MKKILKKFAAAALGAALCVSMAACGNDVMNETSETSIEQEENNMQEVLGIVSGKTYRNDCAGFSVTLDDEWEYFDEEQIAEISGVTMEEFGDDWKKAAIENGTLYAMFAQNPLSADSVNVTVEKNDTDVSLNERVNTQVQQFPAVYEEMGATDIEVNSREEEIDGKMFTTCNSKCNIYGIDMYQKCIIFESEEYVFAMTITSLEQDGIDNITSKITLG